MASVALRGVSKRYPGGGAPAVSELTLEVPDGEFMVLVGPSGCGKSTLLRMVAGFVAPTEGAISIGDRDVTRVRPRDRDVAMVFQSYALYPHMTVRENLEFGLKRRREPRAGIEAKTREAAAVLELEPLLDRRPDTLSGGQRQRVAIGRAMVREPAVYLMDEPLSNLDAKLRVSMRSELARLHATLGVTTVYVTHDQTEAMTLGDRVCVLESGVLQQVGSPRELYERPVNRFVAGFIGSPAMNFLPAELVDGALVHAALRVPLDDRLRLALDGRRSVVLGIRPDDLAFGDEGAVRFTVLPELLEYLGSEQAVEFSLTGGGERSVALVSPRAPVQLGAPLELSVDPDRIHLFDDDSGLALGRSAVDSPTQQPIESGR
jgi:ABC-type sugar transport system ATPase subunit